MRVWNGVFLAMAGLALSGAAVQAQEYGYYRYFGPGPGVPAPYAYAPPPGYVDPPPPPAYFYPPQPYYSYAEPEYPYAYAPPPLGGYGAPWRQPEDGFAVPPPAPRKRETPPVTATARPKDKTASIVAPAGPVNCTKAEEIVASYGFGNVKPVTCTGKIFDFTALRDGKNYRVQVSAATGEITEVRKQP